MRKRIRIKKEKWIQKRKYKKALKRFRKKRQIQKKTNRKKNLQLYKNSATYHYHAKVKHIKSSNSVSIEVPKIFSIRDNLEEMLEFFDEMHFHISKDRKIKLEMGGITNLTSDAILYMLSIMDYYKKKFSSYNIEGNYPSKEECKDLLTQSGFLDFVQPKSFIKPKKMDILSIRHDNLVKGSIAKNVIDFATKMLESKKTVHTRSIYSTLIETMANTKQHAYASSNFQSKWWLIALYNRKENKVNFTFLDNGRGIPITIKKSFKEKFISPLFSNLKDGELIFSALRGEFRTKTLLGYRGKGLPQIFSYSQNKLIDNLLIISNRGSVDCASNGTKNLDRKFHGTLLSWDFIKN